MPQTEYRNCMNGKVSEPSNSVLFSIISVWRFLKYTQKTEEDITEHSSKFTLRIFLLLTFCLQIYNHG